MKAVPVTKMNDAMVVGRTIIRTFDGDLEPTQGNFGTLVMSISGVVLPILKLQPSKQYFELITPVEDENPMYAVSVRTVERL
jgi:hypothetical protein